MLVRFPFAGRLQGDKQRKVCEKKGGVDGRRGEGGGGSLDPR